LLSAAILEPEIDAAARGISAADSTTCHVDVLDLTALTPPERIMRISLCRLFATLLALSIFAARAEAEPQPAPHELPSLGHLTQTLPPQPLVLLVDVPASPSSSAVPVMTIGPNAQASLVPLPPALWTGLTGLGALGAARIIRRIKTLR